MDTNSFPKSMRVFHLIGMILIFIAYVSIYIIDIFPRWSIFQNWLFQAHVLAGIFVLFFVVPRFIVARIKHKEIPPINPPLSKINKFFAESWHIAIYVWMLAMPISGLLLVSADSWYINILGYHLPWIIAQSADYPRTLREVHEVLGTLGLFLILGHWWITLIHHFKLKDNTLVRMFPFLKQRNK